MNPFLALLPYIVALMVAVAIASYAWRHRDVRGAKPFFVEALALASILFGYILELASPTLTGKQFWDEFQWVGTLITPVTSVVFAMAFTKVPQRTIRFTARVLAALSTIFLILMFTNPWHGLLRGPGFLIPGTPFDALYYSFGPVIYVVAGYAYTCALTALVVFLTAMPRVNRALRGQILVIMLGYVILLVGSVIGLTEILDTFQRDVLPLFIILSRMVIAYGLFRHRLFDLIPVARRHIVESIQDAVIVLDDQTRIIEINPAGLAALQSLSAMPLIGMPIGQIAPWLDIGTRLPEASYTIVLSLQKPGLDTLSHFDILVSPLKDEIGRQAGQVIVLRDISEQIETRRALEKKTEQLARTIASLEIARREAEKADQLKSQFLASMSHELRTPLNAVLNFTEMMALGLIGPLTDEQVDVLNKSLSSGRHLMALINDILDINKLESGLMQLFLEEHVDLNTEIMQVLVSIEPMLDGKPVTLIKDVDPGLPRITCDRRRMRQVFYNLLSNAAKFTEEGSITLSAKRQDDAIVFAVMDTGPGIPKDAQGAIFESFIQTEVGMKHSGSTGLGLPISLRLVEAHGGKLWVDSDEGEGAAFFFSLPLDIPITSPSRSG